MPATNQVRSLVKKMFGKHLLLTNTVVSGGMMALGDLVQQSLERVSGKAHSPNYDWNRTSRMAIVGVLGAPLLHGWYKFLDTRLVGTGISTVMKKVIADQIVASPALLLGFFYGMGTLEGKSLENCTEEIKEKFIFLYTVDCLVWPPVQFINFRFLPQHYRVAYVSCAVLIWDTFLSYVKHKDSYSTTSGSTGSSNIPEPSTCSSL